MKGEGAEGLKRLSGSLTSAPPETAPEAPPGGRALALSGAQSSQTPVPVPAASEGVSVAVLACVHEPHSSTLIERRGFIIMYCSEAEAMRRGRAMLAAPSAAFLL